MCYHTSSENAELGSGRGGGGGATPAARVLPDVSETVNRNGSKTMNTTTRKIPAPIASDRLSRASASANSGAASTLAPPERLGAGLAVLRAIVALVLTGPGAYALDSVRGRRRTEV
jgi:hypothetical protein